MTHPNIKDHILEEIIADGYGAIVLNDGETWGDITNATVVLAIESDGKEWHECISLDDLISFWFDSHGGTPPCT